MEAGRACRPFNTPHFSYSFYPYIFKIQFFFDSLKTLSICRCQCFPVVVLRFSHAAYLTAFPVLENTGANTKVGRLEGIQLTCTKQKLRWQIYV